MGNRNFLLYTVRIGSFATVVLLANGCVQQDFGIGQNISASVASVAASPSSSPSSVTTPTPKPTATPTPSPSPTPTATPCSETCTVSNGVGVQSCGQPSTCTLTKCNDGFVVSNGSCVATTSVDKFSCTSYEQLVLNATSNQIQTAAGTEIPAQDPSGKGVCYYYPIIVQNPALSGSSYLTGTSAAHHDQDVLSRDHDVGSDANTAWHPYTMASSNVNFQMAGSRILNITGGSVSSNQFTTSNVQIDNFFLVGVFPASTSLTPANLKSYYSAWGTGDSVINGTASGSTTATQGIAFNPSGLNLTTNANNTYPDGTTGAYSNVGIVTSSQYAMIPLTAEASGGTASVPEVSVTNLIQPEVNTTIDFRALDCGSGRALSSIYLLVQ